LSDNFNTTLYEHIPTSLSGLSSASGSSIGSGSEAGGCFGCNKTQQENQLLQRDMPRPTSVDILSAAAQMYKNHAWKSLQYVNALEGYSRSLEMVPFNRTLSLFISGF